MSIDSLVHDYIPSPSSLSTAFAAIVAVVAVFALLRLARRVLQSVADEYGDGSIDNIDESDGYQVHDHFQEFRDSGSFSLAAPDGSYMERSDDGVVSGYDDAGAFVYDRDGNLHRV